MIFSEESYDKMIEELFQRFPSFQKAGVGAYKPGIANMEIASQLLGHPDRKYKVVHVAGTNGKGSVSNMLSSVLAASGLKVGLYTSPHILDFRERMRVIAGPTANPVYTLIPKEDVWNFVQQWKEMFDHLDLSFFEITTLMAMSWFASQEVDVVVLETGLGGRLDSTNIVTPVLSVITNIGLDHCDLLGETLPEIAFEKAGIIKPNIPVIVGESDPLVNEVFERKVLYTNISEPAFMGNRSAIMSVLVFADKVVPGLWDRHEGILASMDLKGDYQVKNLRTVLAALDVLGGLSGFESLSLENRTCYDYVIVDAIAHTALRTGFHGRWEKLSDDPFVICDIGHNEHGLKYNFAQLEDMRLKGECSELIIVYGSVADKDVDAAVSLIPEGATCVFTQAVGRRALSASAVMEKYMDSCAVSGRKSGDVFCEPDVSKAVELALRLAEEKAVCRPIIYVGGSTYVVSEAVTYLKG